MKRWIVVAALLVAVSGSSHAQSSSRASELTMSGTAVPLTTGWKLIGSSVQVSPFTHFAIQIHVGTSANADATRWYFQVSDDNTVFRTLMNSDWTNTVADTMMVQLACPAGSAQFAVTMPDRYLGRYLRIFGSRDSSSGSARSASIIKIWGQVR